MERQQTDYNIFLGKMKNANEYVFLDYAFKHWEMSGLTYSAFEFATEEELENLKEDYYSSDDAYDMFIEYIKYHRPRNVNYDDWSDLAMSESDYPFDDSYSHESWLVDAMEWVNKREERLWWIGYEDPYEKSNCIGWWRMWKDSEYSIRDNYEYVDEENFKKFILLYNEYEVYE